MDLVQAEVAVSTGHIGARADSAELDALDGRSAHLMLMHMLDLVVHMGLMDMLVLDYDRGVVMMMMVMHLWDGDHVLSSIVEERHF